MNKGFSPAARARLDKYVYALLYPTSYPGCSPAIGDRIFYIGKGTDNRCFQHASNPNSVTANVGEDLKTEIIEDICKKCMQNPEIVIIRHGFHNDYEALELESVLIGIWGRANAIQGHSADLYNLTPEEVEKMYSEPFCPDQAMTVFVFPIQNQIGVRSDYDATRMYWGLANPDHYGATFGVGLVQGVSRTAYEISEWEDLTYNGRALKGFLSPNHPNPSVIGHLVNKDWSRILKGVGYWNRGNPIVVEFDGKGKYRILRGSADKGWRDCGQGDEA